MDLDLTTDELVFREELLDWLADHLVGEFKEFDGQGAPSDDFGWDLRIAWDRELAAGGWLGIGFPAEYGGRPATLREEIIYHIELASARAPYIATFNSVDLFARALLIFGTEQQKLRFIPPILQVEELWTQGFSEPNAGSDLAGVRTRAELDGDRWVINGQKIWTSFAGQADWLWMLCRTATLPGEPAHRGLSMLLVPVDQPGVDVRVIRSMLDGYDLCEVFFDDAGTTADLVMGAVGEGWRVAMGSLQVERGTTLLPYQIRFEHEMEGIIRLARCRGSSSDPVMRDELARAWCGLRVLRMNSERALSALLAGDDPGAVASIAKTVAAQWHQRAGELKMKVLGMDGTVVGPGYALDRMQRSFLLSRAETIYGGTDQIQHNLLAERILGLPR
jgi:alkylation response protein AidB-like acyl-CoA dehydrogenase